MPNTKPNSLPITGDPLRGGNRALPSPDNHRAKRRCFDSREIPRKLPFPRSRLACKRSREQLVRSWVFPRTVSVNPPSVWNVLPVTCSLGIPARDGDRQVRAWLRIPRAVSPGRPEWCRCCPPHHGRQAGCLEMRKSAQTGATKQLPALQFSCRLSYLTVTFLLSGVQDTIPLVPGV